MTPKEITALLYEAITAEGRIEPKKRMVGGRFGWACHRFPIKGGISRHEAFLRDICETNSLLRAKFEGLK